MNQLKIIALTLLVGFSGARDVARAEQPFDVERDVEYVKLGEESLTCDLRVPRGQGPFPGVLCVHGGAWMAGSKEHMNHVADRLAKEGYMAMSINYRLAPKHIFPAQIDDCRTALNWMRSQSARLKLDVGHVGGFGYSAGAHLVSLLATANAGVGMPDTRLQCLVAGGTPCDFRLMPAKWTALAYWLGGTREKKPEAYELASPLKFVSADDPPAFFYHGESDLLVPRFSSQIMASSLRRAGVEATLHMVPKAGHLEAFFNEEALNLAVAFLDKQLKAPAAKPEISPPP